VRSKLCSIGLATAVVLAAAACGAFGSPAPANGAFESAVAPGLSPRMLAADAVRITRDYLGEQTPELNVPAAHVPADVRQVWAVKAADAWKLDPCIPVQTSDRVVWVTVGVGDYLGRGDLPWMSVLLKAQDANRFCLSGAGVGTIVIDDATGEILGAFPGSHAVATAGF
jgi:hypothetical protein